MKRNKTLLFILIPLITLMTGYAGRVLTYSGMNWYQTIKLPGATPPNFVFGIVWTIIFTLTAASALIVLEKYPKNFFIIAWAYLINAALNISWSYFFFYKNMIGSALIISCSLIVSISSIMFLIKDESRLAALLLSPYLIWVIFATYLNFMIYQINVI